MRKRRILIVGGGSSGWMTAAYLEAALRNDPRGEVEITLVESPDIPRIGVGEATVPSINHVLGVIGVNLADFMRAVNGTFKQSIKHVNWLHENGHSYHHPFSREVHPAVDRLGLDWLMSDRSIPFMETVSAQPELCHRGLAPVMLGQWDFGHPLAYAFHLNAQKFADFLCGIATARGVRHLLDDVTDVELEENGSIAAVRTKSGERLTADLFIDCTGFASLLIEKALDVDWIDFSQWLLCDRAVVMRVPHEHYYPGQVRPYTTATALSSGWAWETVLTSGRAVGYVHSSNHIGLDDAERELRRYEGAHSEGLDARTVHFKVGMRRDAWVGNCLAIGLSGGFIEPLESTGLYLSYLAAIVLAEQFPWRDEDMGAMAFRTNRIMATRYQEILDFINLHYCLTRRTDSEFWREVQRPERVVPRLQAKLDYWAIRPPAGVDFIDQFLPGMSIEGPHLPSAGTDSRPLVDTGGLWNHHSYECILYGMDFMADEYRQQSAGDRPKAAVTPQVAGRLRAAPAKLTPHDVWLQQVVGMENYGPRNDAWCRGGV
ncbi:MAG: tryptophan 7-halogenase [Gammaproteobacteria bacterium]|jgi:tryptophan halogenase